MRGGSASPAMNPPSHSDLLAPGCRIIASIGGAGAEEIARRLRQVDRRADLVEIRLDRVPAPEVAGLVTAAPLPVVATCRRRQDGGQFDGEEAERAQRLRAAVRAGAAWVDLEWGSETARSASAFAPARVILSWHDFNGTPVDLEERLRSMRSASGATWLKLVPTACGLGDLVRLRHLLRDASDLVAFAMGPTGAASRLLAPVWGSRATYASGSAEPTAPGQLPVQEMLDLYRLRRAGRSTRVAGLLGWPLGHSLSPRLHNLGYEALGLDWIYVPIETESADGLRDFLIALEIEAASVTLPHKEACIPHLDELDPLARRLGAVNTVLRRGGVLRGHNTDVEAALAPLRSAVALGGKRIALLGAGGAARALAFTLPREGCRVRIFNRTAERARRVAEEAGVEWGRWEDLEGEAYDVLIQATPVGMHPRGDDMPLPEAWLRGSLVYDLIYNPPETALLRAARRRGLAVLGGVEMLLGQAAAQFRLFTGVEPPLEDWRACLSSALARTE